MLIVLRTVVMMPIAEGIKPGYPLHLSSPNPRSLAYLNLEGSASSPYSYVSICGNHSG